MCPEWVETASWVEISRDDDYAAVNGNNENEDVMIMIMIKIKIIGNAMRIYVNK